MQFAQQQVELNTGQAIRLLEAKGYALHSEAYLEASPRRCIARSMQMPKMSSRIDEHVAKIFMENIPRSWVHSWLTELGWRTLKASKELLCMETSKLQAVGQMAGLLELCGKKFVYIGFKLFKPAKEPRAWS
eukprot:1434203-Pleurochrysis_carterae.AAC.1